MAGEHAGRIAAVTGAAQGLGLAIAEDLARKGATVVVTDVAPQVEDSARALREQGLTVTASRFDVADHEAVRAAFAAIADEVGGVDILVNNAGLKFNFGTAAKMDPEEWDREISVNLSGTFYCTQQVLPGMADQGWGRIISISSMVGLMGLFGAPGYAATKAGMMGFTRTVALENFRHGITANTICPGVIRVNDQPPAPNVARMLKAIPGEERGEPSDITAAVSYLASDGARFVTGVDLPVDAGARLLYTPG